MMMTLCGLLLVSGCAKIDAEYCVVSRPIWFASPEVLEYLLKHDPLLVRSVVDSNLKRQKLCGVK